MKHFCIFKAMIPGNARQRIMPKSKVPLQASTIRWMDGRQDGGGCDRPGLIGSTLQVYTTMACSAMDIITVNVFASAPLSGSTWNLEYSNLILMIGREKVWNHEKNESRIVRNLVVLCERAFLFMHRNCSGRACPLGLPGMW